SCGGKFPNLPIPPWANRQVGNLPPRQDEAGALIMSKTRILIVSGAVVVRRLLAHTLSEDAALEVVGTVSTGPIALARVPDLAPGVVVLDLDTEEPAGLKALIRAYPRLPVVV